MARRKRLINKRVWKLVAGKCRICKKEMYEALDVHRIIPGEEGGEYTDDNSVVLCAVCHRYVTAGLWVVKRWVHSTAGRLLWVIRDGKEEFL